MHSGLSEASREAIADGVSLENILKQALLWDQAADAEDVKEEALLSARRLFQAMGRMVSVTKKEVLHRISRVTYRPCTKELKLQQIIWQSERPSSVNWT